MIRSLYEVLQVRPDADPEVIAAAYRALSKRYHPDVNKAADSTSVMKEMNRAYEVLSDAVARAEYDRSLSAQQGTRSSEQTASSQKSERQPDEAPANGWTQKKTSGSEVRVQSNDGRFSAYDNGTVLDTRTNLMWAAQDNGDYNINWADAKSYCENYRGGGYSDWRMPKLDELKGLYDSAKTQLGSTSEWNIHTWWNLYGLNIHKWGNLYGWYIHMATELIHITGYLYWAQETRVNEHARKRMTIKEIIKEISETHWGTEHASFDFHYGYGCFFLHVNSCHALPVRSGK